MKSHIATTLAVYAGVLRDASATWPKSTKRFEQDLSCLRRASEHRGLAFFTLTLPAYGKVVDRSLEAGSFLCSEMPQGVPMIKHRPELFGSLWQKVFDECGTLSNDPDLNALLFLRQLCYLAKKLKVELSEEKVRQSVKDFMDVDRSLPKVRQDTWGSETPRWRSLMDLPAGTPHLSKVREYDQGEIRFWDYIPEPPIDWGGLRLLCRRITSAMGEPDVWSLRPKHGPGAVAEGQRGKVRKYDFANWPTRLENLFPYDWYGSGNLQPDSHPDQREHPSRLVAVPKDQKGPRLICAEPTSHQWMQQSIWQWLEGKVNTGLLRHSVNFRSQENSREGALRSSLTREDCTIDLSSASDRLSCELVEYVFQGANGILDAFHAVRTQCTRQRLTKECDSHLRLNKFSTQGSALTFPVESIVFTLLAVFAMRWSEGRSRDWDETRLENDFRRVTVFGDDIIAPSTAYDAILRIFSECSLKVNADKSFVRGFFRESCGMDAYNGVNITPTYLLQTYTGTAESTVSLVLTSNNFHNSGFWRAAEAVSFLIPEEERRKLPVLLVNGEDRLMVDPDIKKDSGHLGLSSFTGSEFNHLRKVFSKTLHRVERCVLAITSKVKRAHGTGQSRLSQFFWEYPIYPVGEFKIVDWKSGEPGSVVVGKTTARVSFLTDRG